MAECMGNWIRPVFLAKQEKPRIAVTVARAVTILSLCWAGLVTFAEGAEPTDAGSKPGAVQVIPPEVKPREVSEAKIDTELFEVGLFEGETPESRTRSSFYTVFEFEGAEFRLRMRVHIPGQRPVGSNQFNLFHFSPFRELPCYANPVCSVN